MADARAQVVTVADRMDPARAAALWATLKGETRDVASGDPLPPLAHLIYFWNPAPEAGLGHDGHAALGGVIPDLGLPRRMWAGGRFTFHAPLRAGVAAEKISRVIAVTKKEGRTGPLAFVTVRHDIRQKGMPVLSEEQDIVYRAADAPAGEPPHAGEEPDERRALRLSEVTLFRYSALTFNGHRIHYDADYAREEGYPGLIVHGPLLAASLAMWAAERGDLKTFTFRATSPLFLGDVAWLCRAGSTFWVEGPRRRLCMRAEAG